MKNLRIGERLGVGFALMVALLTLISVISVVRLAQLNKSEQTITSVVYPRATAAERMSYLAVDMSRVARNVILLTDADRLATNKATLETDRVSFAEHLATFEKLADDDKGRELVAKLRTQSAAYATFTDSVVALGLQGKAKEATDKLYGPDNATQIALLATLKEVVALQQTTMEEAGAAAQAAYDQALWIVIGTTMAAVAFAIACAWAVSRSITAPMMRAVDIADRINSGELGQHITVDSKDETGLLFGALRRMQESLSNAVRDVRRNSEGVATASAQIASGNQDLSERTERQAAALEETAASMEELGSTVRQNSDNAKQANQLALGASTVAVKGGEVVARVVETMKGINDSSKRIADIIGTIDSIAFQTNILALNAAVEAARAGEQGRGFAVVASEVRSLAQRSADAAREIKGLIGTSVERVEQGTVLVDQAGATMIEIVTAIQRVTDIMGEISSASVEQSAGVAQVGEAITQMDQATQQNAALVEESAAAAESLKLQASQLVQAVAVFNLGASASAAPATPAAAVPATARVAAPARRVAPVRAAPTARTKALTSVSATTAAPATSGPAAGAGVVVDRRGPNRAKNVVRPPFNSGSAASATAAAEPVKTGSNSDEWESF